MYLIDSASKVGQSNKLKPVYKGPYLVIEVLSSILYRLASQKKTMVMHHDRLRACPDPPTIPLWIKRERHRILKLGGDEDDEDNMDNSEQEDHQEPQIENSEHEDQEIVGGKEIPDENVPEGLVDSEDEELKDSEDEEIKNSEDEEMEIIQLPFPDPPKTRSGRKPRRPAYLTDYSD